MSLAVSTTQACQRVFLKSVTKCFCPSVRLRSVAKEGGRHPGRPGAGVAAGRGNPGQEGGDQGGGANERVSGEPSLLSTFPPPLFVVDVGTFFFLSVTYGTSPSSADNLPLECAGGDCRRDSGHVIYITDMSHAFFFSFFEYKHKKGML